MNTLVKLPILSNGKKDFVVVPIAQIFKIKTLETPEENGAISEIKVRTETYVESYVNEYYESHCDVSKLFAIIQNQQKP